MRKIFRLHQTPEGVGKEEEEEEEAASRLRGVSRWWREGGGRCLLLLLLLLAVKQKCDLRSPLLKEKRGGGVAAVLRLEYLQ